MGQLEKERRHLHVLMCTSGIQHTVQYRNVTACLRDAARVKRDAADDHPQIPTLLAILGTVANHLVSSANPCVVGARDFLLSLGHSDHSWRPSCLQKKNGNSSTSYSNVRRNFRDRFANIRVVYTEIC